MARKAQKTYTIDITPVKNGWVVTGKGGDSMVFTDREDMMKHMNDLVPAMGCEQEFINAIDADPNEDYMAADEMMLDEVLNTVMGSFSNSQPKTKRRKVKK